MRFSKVILATNNRHKIAEITALLEGAGVTILTKAGFPDFPEIEETANTLAENALEKSRTIFRKYGIPAVADDTGLEVDCLGGAPGVLMFLPRLRSFHRLKLRQIGMGDYHRSKRVLS